MVDQRVEEFDEVPGIITHKRIPLNHRNDTWYILVGTERFCIYRTTFKLTDHSHVFAGLMIWVQFIPGTNWINDVHDRSRYERKYGQTPTPGKVIQPKDAVKK